MKPDVTGPTFTIDIEDSAIARLVVRGAARGASITRVTTVAPPVHVVSGGDVQARLEQPWAPDDGMTLATALLPGDARRALGALPPEVEWSYLQWAEGSRAEAGGAVLASLPDGVYWLVRTKLPSRAAAELLLGNVRSAAPANACVLVDEPPFYAAAFGAGAAIPSGATPLVGLAVLNYVGDSVIDGVLCFELVRPADAASDQAADAVVVLPAEGDLVIDVLEGFSESATRVARGRWSGGRARALAHRLAWGSGSAPRPL